MRRKKQALKIIMLLILASGAGCTGRNEKEHNDTIVVGSKNFTEQLIIGELIAQTIENRTDLRVERKFNLGGTMICHEGLARGELDVYAEYTGTALTAILKKPTVANPEQAYRIVSDAYSRDYDCEWIDPFGFNNTYILTVRRDAAEKNSWASISDLADSAETLKAGFTAEFMERKDGYKGLKEAYGFAFGDTRDMEPSLMYQAIAQKNVDIICAFATDGRIEVYDLVMLEDDKHFFPPYYAAPVVRNQTLRNHPEVRKALQMLSGVIDDTAMRNLNNRVDRDKMNPAVVARDFLVNAGISPADKTKEKE